MTTNFEALDNVIKHMDRVDFETWCNANRDEQLVRYLDMQTEYKEQYSFEEYLQYVYEDHG